MAQQIPFSEAVEALRDAWQQQRMTWKSFAVYFASYKVDDEWHPIFVYVNGKFTPQTKSVAQLSTSIPGELEVCSGDLTPDEFDALLEALVAMSSLRMPGCSPVPIDAMVHTRFDPYASTIYEPATQETLATLLCELQSNYPHDGISNTPTISHIEAILREMSYESLDEMLERELHIPRNRVKEVRFALPRGIRASAEVTGEQVKVNVSLLRSFSGSKLDVSVGRDLQSASELDLNQTEDGTEWSTFTGQCTIPVAPASDVFVFITHPGFPS
ncbi:MAG: hypothetical protein ACYCOU_16695, partial [Sulfobacillus sp.]